MNPRVLHRFVAGLVFLISAAQFLMTVQPTVSFWDPGELSAAAFMLQVPHPPGGPLFSLIGHLFYLLPLPGDPGLRMNLVSVLASALSVLFLYLIAVRLMEHMKRSDSTRARVATSLAAAIGALALSFCDTFWFNGVEANYFAASTLLFSLMLWLILLWAERPEGLFGTRYLVLIAYLAGLSSGVHLMSVPTIFAAVMIVVFRWYETDDAFCKKSATVLIGHAALLFLIVYAMWNSQTSQEPPTSEEFHAYDLRFSLTMAAISLGVMLIFRKKVFRRDSLYAPLLAGGAALAVVYPGVIKLLPQLIHKLSGNDSTTGVIVLFLIVGALLALAAWAQRKKKTLLHLSALGTLFVILGFSTYTMIVIRANQHPPMNENDPESFSGLLTYLNREQYGDFPIFKRRWSSDPDRQTTFTQYSSDFDFFLRYQMNHMFVRYMLFNFVGRESRDQDAEWTWRQLYGIPLLIGLFGLYFHFRSDWKMATVFLFLFLIMGFLIAFYQNQQEPQPRERDYFYAGAYFLFALWIAMGMKGIFTFVMGALRGSWEASAGLASVALAAFLLVPGRMAQTNWHSHDRSGNRVAWETAYNMLQTCQKDAILITGGDNDTFPLWYLQDVEGVRRDVRVVCLSLANVNWYIQEMKDPPYYPEAKAVPISMSDAQIARIEPVVWKTRTMELPVPPEVYAREGIADTSITHQGKITWRMANTLQYGQTGAIRVQDIVVLDILRTNKWKRPIYFAVTCGPDSRIGLSDYLRLSGFAFRLVPAPASRSDMGIDPDALRANLFTDQQGFSRTPRYGFKISSTGDTTVFLDETDERMASLVRSAFRALAHYELEGENDPAKAAAVLQRMDHRMPLSRLPLSLEEEIDFALLYSRAGMTGRVDQLAPKVDEQFKALTSGGPLRNPYLYEAMLQLYEARGDFSGALSLLGSLKRLYPNDPSVQARIDTLRAREARAGEGAR